MEKDFETLYQEIIKDGGDKINQVNSEIKREKKITIIFMVVLLLVIDPVEIYIGVEVIKMSFLQTAIILGIVSVIMLILLFYICEKGLENNQEYKVTFKRCIIEKILKNYYAELMYVPPKQMDRETYNEGAYKEKYNVYSSDDYLEGKIDDKFKIKMAEVHTVNEITYRDLRGYTHKTRETKFHGLFAKIEMDKTIKNELTIKPNSIFFEKTKLEMDSQEFEKLFDVFSKDEIVGMQILTHDVMEELVEFKNKCKYRFDICVCNNIMYLRLSTGSVFEIKSFRKGILDKEVLHEYYNILGAINNLARKIINTVEDMAV